MNLTLIWFMIVAHCIGDMCLQSSFIAHNKHRIFGLMFFHALTVTGIITIPMFLFDSLTLHAVIILLVSHIIIDTWKSRQPRDDEHFWCNYVDQFFHLVFILIVSL